MMPMHTQQWSWSAVLWTYGRRLRVFSAFGTLYHVKCISWKSDFANLPYFDLQPDSAVFSPDDKHQRSELTTAELFSGGYAGWRQAHDCISSVYVNKVVKTLWALDHNSDAATTYSKSFRDVQIVQQETRSQIHEMISSGTMPFFCCDIAEDSWLQSVVGFHLDSLSCSAPCVSWSGAQSQLGLEHPGGIAFVQALKKLRVLSPSIFLIENVAKIRGHKHWPILEALLRWCRFQIWWASTTDLQDVGPQHRERFLLVACSLDVQSEPQSKSQGWVKLKAHSLASFGAHVSVGADSAWVGYAKISDEA